MQPEFDHLIAGKQVALVQALQGLLPFGADAVRWPFVLIIYLPVNLLENSSRPFESKVRPLKLLVLAPFYRYMVNISPHRFLQSRFACKRSEDRSKVRTTYMLQGGWLRNCLFAFSCAACWPGAIISLRRLPRTAILCARRIRSHPHDISTLPTSSLNADLERMDSFGCSAHFTVC